MLQTSTGGFHPANNANALPNLEYAFLVADVDDRIVYASDAAADLLECDRPLVGKLVGEVLPCALPKRDDAWETTVGSLGVVVQPVGSGRELFVRRTADKPLRGRFEAIFSQAAVGLALTDLEGRLVLVNDRFCEILGRGRDELLESAIPGITHPEDAAVSLDAHRSAAREGVEYTIEKRYVRRDGTTVWASVSGSRILDGAGRPTYVLGVVQDITTQKWAEQELSQTQQRLVRQANLLELSHDAILVRELDGTILFWNRGAEELYGWSREEAEGRLTHDLLRTVHPVSIEAMSREIESSGAWQGELVHSTRDGVRIVVESRQVLVEEVGSTVILETNHDVTWRKRTEERLRQNEAFLKLVFDAMPACVAYVDNEHRYLFLNERYRDWFGVAPEQFIGKGVEALVGKQAYDDRIGLLRRAMNGAPVVFESSQRLANGRVIDIEIVYAPEISEGVVRGVVIMAHDVSARKRAEAQIRRSEARLHLALANMPITVFNQDLELRYTWIHNPVFGIEPDRVVGSTDDDLFDEASATRLTELKRTVIETGRPIRSEVFVRGERTAAYLDLSLEPSHNEKGEIDGVSGAAIDITETLRQRDRQITLAELSERMRTAADPERLLDDVTALVAGRLGYDRCVFGAVDGSRGLITVRRQFAHDLPALTEEIDLDDLGTDVAAMLRAGREVAVEDVLADDRTKDRAPIYESSSIRSFAAVPLQRDGEWVGSFCCQCREPHVWSRDELELLRAVAERTWFAVESSRMQAELERRVEERTSELLAKNQELEGFTYSVSHDMRTPLRGIVANSRMLLDDFGGYLPPEGHERLGRLSAAALKMAHLVDDLLQFARLGVQDLRKERTDLSELAEEVAQMVREHQPDIEFSIQAGIWDDCDPKLLGLALHNLFENAAKYRVPGRPARVVFGREEVGERLDYVVHDNGIGFDMEYVNKLFRPFERLHRDDEYPGTGIGLANVRRIVERHGGQVWAEGTPNDGATFRFTLG